MEDVMSVVDENTNDSSILQFGGGDSRSAFEGLQ